MPVRPRGLALLIAVLALTGVGPEQPSARAADGSDAAGLGLLHQLQAALGGADRIAAIRDFEETIQAQAWDASGAALGEVRKRTRWIRAANVLRLDQRGPRGTYVLFFDGPAGSGWEILPDLQNPDPYRTTGTAIALVGGELTFARNYLTGFNLNCWLADRLPGYQVTSPAPHVLRIAHGGDTPDATDTALDPATSLPLTSTGVSLADPDHPVPAEMRYVAWTTVAGVRFPTHEINLHSGVKRGEIISADLRVNAGLDRHALDTKPQGVQPDIPRR